MDILILNFKDIKNPEVGGAEVLLYEYANRLIRDGHTVTWFTRTFDGCKEEDTIGDGIRVIRRGGKFSVYFHAYLYYRNLTHKPDNVLESINTLVWQTPLYVPRNKRVVLINQLAKEVFFYGLPPIIAQIAYAVEELQYLSYKSTRILTYSPSVKEDVIRMGIPRDEIKTFPLGLDHSRYVPGTKSKTPLFVFVARLVAMKRPDMCVRAMKYVIERYPTAQLAIVGYGPMENALLELIRIHGLEKNVYIVNKNQLFFEKNKNDKKVELLQKAWALLLPSVKEGWGMVVTEAAACGTPSIVTNVTGLRDSVQHEKTGLIVSANPTDEEYAEAMIRILKDSTVRKRLSASSRTFSKTLSWDKSYKEFKHLLFA